MPDTYSVNVDGVDYPFAWKGSTPPTPADYNQIGLLARQQPGHAENAYSLNAPKIPQELAPQIPAYAQQYLQGGDASIPRQLVAQIKGLPPWERDAAIPAGISALGRAAILQQAWTENPGVPIPLSQKLYNATQPLGITPQQARTNPGGIAGAVAQNQARRQALEQQIKDFQFRVQTNVYNDYPSMQGGETLSAADQKKLAAAQRELAQMGGQPPQLDPSRISNLSEGVGGKLSAMALGQDPNGPNQTFMSALAEKTMGKGAGGAYQTNQGFLPSLGRTVGGILEPDSLPMLAGLGLAGKMLSPLANAALATSVMGPQIAEGVSDIRSGNAPEGYGKLVGNALIIGGFSAMHGAEGAKFKADLRGVAAGGELSPEIAARLDAAYQKPPGTFAADAAKTAEANAANGTKLLPDAVEAADRIVNPKKYKVLDQQAAVAAQKAAVAAQKAADAGQNNAPDIYSQLGQTPVGPRGAVPLTQPITPPGMEGLIAQHEMAQAPEVTLTPPGGSPLDLARIQQAAQPVDPMSDPAFRADMERHQRAAQLSGQPATPPDPVAIFSDWIKGQEQDRPSSGWTVGSLFNAYKAENPHINAGEFGQMFHDLVVRQNEDPTALRVIPSDNQAKGRFAYFDSNGKPVYLNSVRPPGGNENGSRGVPVQPTADLSSTFVPEVAPEAAPPVQPAPAVPPQTAGAPHITYTPKGTPVPFHYEVVDASDLTPSHTDTGAQESPGYDQAMQPRNVALPAQQAVIDKIARRLEFARAADAPTTADGAPLVGPDLHVESGNHRALGIMRAIRQYPEKYAAYVADLGTRAAELGIDPAKVAALDHPVLVRVSDMAHESATARANFAREAGESPTQRMSAPEIAASDARALHASDALMRYNPASDLSSSNNADFVRRFMAQIPETEHSGFVDDEGKLSQEGKERIQDAIIAAAYDDKATVQRLTNDATEETKQVGNALRQSANAIAVLKQAEKAGNVHPSDISSDLVDAAHRYVDIKRRGQTVAENLGTEELFGKSLSPEAESLLQFFETKNSAGKVTTRSAASIGEMLRYYVDLALKQGNPKQVSESSIKPPTKLEMIEAAMRRVTGEESSGNLFDEPAQSGEPAAKVNSGTTQRSEPARSTESNKPGSPAAAEGKAAETGEKLSARDYLANLADKVKASTDEAAKNRLSALPLDIYAGRILEGFLRGTVKILDAYHSLKTQHPEVTEDEFKKAYGVAMERYAETVKGVPEEFRSEIPKPEGMPSRSEEPLTGAKNAVTEAEREARGTSPVERQAYTTMGEAYQRGREAVESGKADPRALAQSVDAKPRPLTAQEVGVLGYDRARLINEHNEVLKLAEGETDPTKLLTLKAQIERIENDYQANEGALVKGGREQSAAFNARKMMIGQDYSLLQMEQRAKLADPSKPLTADEKSQIADLHEKLSKSEADYKGATDRIKELEAQRVVRRAAVQDALETRRAGRARNQQALLKERDGLVQDLVKTLSRLNAGVPPEAIPIVAKLAKNAIERGVNTAQGVIDDVFTAVQQHLPDVTKDDILDAITAKNKKAVSTDPDVLKANAQRVQIRRQFDAMVEARHPKDLGEKAGALHREFILSGGSVFQKLVGATVWNAPVEAVADLFGSLAGKMKVKGQTLESQAGTEGGFNVRAKVAGVKGALSREALQNAREALHPFFNKINSNIGAKGGNEISSLAGNPAHTELGGILGSLHGAEKSFLQTGIFREAMVRRTARAMQQGLDIADPEVLTQIQMDAALDAQRGILQSENALSRTLSNGIEHLQRSNAPSAKVAGFILRTLIPITRVSSNYVGKAIDMTGAGVLRGAYEHIKAGRSAEPITPEVADSIIRAYKYGGLGLLAAYVGLTQPQFFKASGYYDEKQRNAVDSQGKKLETGELEIAGKRVPHILVHNPFFEAVQFWATLRRAANPQVGKTGAAIEAGRGMAEQIPGVRPVVDIGSAIKEPRTIPQALGQYAGNVTIPQAVQQVARATDKNSKGDVIKRSPKDFGQGYKMGIPGLRKTVPQPTKVRR